MKVLGLNAWHADSSACLIDDGRIVAAAEEERFRRVKHWAGFPSHAIRYCLEESGTRLDDLEHVAVNSDPWANLGSKLVFTLRHRPAPDLVLERLRNRSRHHSIAGELAGLSPHSAFGGRIHRVEHHLAHLASAFLASPFAEATVVSVDGFGDFSSAAWGFGKASAITVEERVPFPHSLGIFYQALTQYLGFPRYGDEYKVMGLAPYGAPRFLSQMRRIVRPADNDAFTLDTRYFRHQREPIADRWPGGAPEFGPLYSQELCDLLGPPRPPDEPLTQRNRDIACSVQAIYEEALFRLLNALHARHGTDALALAGGCAMNSVANGKVKRKTPFRRVYVQPAPGDAGGAVGAALHIWHKLNGSGRCTMDHAYLGPAFANGAVTGLLDARASELEGAGCAVDQVADEGALCRRTAEAIARGHVVGWFQGRMEWGPRALGNRSILCDPRRSDMKEILNRRIKRRESFRPFAPSILREKVAEWFEDDEDVPFMMQVLPVRAEKRPLVPAVTHVDGSGRLHTVDRSANPLYHRLISVFRDLTGIPMVLNTSFNENEPVVCRPEEALDCFLRTSMDVLVMGDMVVRR